MSLRNSTSAASQRRIRKYAMPSASRIDAFSGSRRFAFSSATVACAGMPRFKWARPCWKRLYVDSLMARDTESSPLPSQPDTSSRVSARFRFRRARGPSTASWAASASSYGARAGPPATAGAPARAPRAAPRRAGSRGRRRPPSRRARRRCARGRGERVDARVDAHRECTRSAGGRPGLDEAAQVAAGVHGVGGGHEQRRLRAVGHRPRHRIGGAEHAGLADVPELEAEPRAVPEQLLDLLCEVARDDRGCAAACSRELAEERRDHRTAVDRQDRLRPVLGERT